MFSSSKAHHEETSLNMHIDLCGLQLTHSLLYKTYKTKQLVHL